jgi:hypothetical protein
MQDYQSIVSLESIFGFRLDLTSLKKGSCNCGSSAPPSLTLVISSSCSLLERREVSLGSILVHVLVHGYVSCFIRSVHSGHANS